MFLLIVPIKLQYIFLILFTYGLELILLNFLLQVHSSHPHYCVPKIGVVGFVEISDHFVGDVGRWKAVELLGVVLEHFIGYLGSYFTDFLDPLQCLLCGSMPLPLPSQHILNLIVILIHVLSLLQLLHILIQILINLDLVRRGSTLKLTKIIINDPYLRTIDYGWVH